ncbi:alpha-mannosyltransferase [Coniochaeta sp. 2T2.1]|nr:alpha-mannosyltransferase [Coniochaeta sp. 2T2.1]
MVSPHLRRAASWLLLAFVGTCLFIRFSSKGVLTATPLSFQVATAESVPRELYVVFWKTLLGAMMRTAPDFVTLEAPPQPDDKLILYPALSSEDSRLDNIQVSSDDFRSLQQSHAEFVGLLPQIAPLLPFDERPRGIVMTTHGNSIGVAMTSILMLRRTGSVLPVQLFLNSKAEYDPSLCDDTLRKLGAECLVMEKLWKTTPDMPMLKGYQFKIFSILFSTFQQVLFLDADCWPLANPNSLFDSEPYKSVIMFDKTKHATTLILSAYYNFHGPEVYYSLFSQSAPGQGDKETFLHAALALQNPFYDVGTHVGTLGRWLNGSFESAAMIQADPTADYELRRGRKKLKGPVGNTGKGDQHADEIHAKPLFIHHNTIKINIYKLAECLEHLCRKDERGEYKRLWNNGDALVQSFGYDAERCLWDLIIKTRCRGSTSQALECHRFRDYYKAVFE